MAFRRIAKRIKRKPRFKLKSGFLFFKSVTLNLFQGLF